MSEDLKAAVIERLQRAEAIAGDAGTPDNMRDALREVAEAVALLTGALAVALDHLAALDERQRP